MKEHEYIQVPLKWFERLGHYVDQLESEWEANGRTERADSITVALIGYCSSAKTILKNFKQ